jgi:Xaa-Pro aminopeptidase
MNLSQVQSYLQNQGYDGWLLYNFRDLNPIALSVVGLEHGGSRRWFCWIPARGKPCWLIHAIESNMFADLPAELQGPQTRYVAWQEMAAALPNLIGCDLPDAKARPKILMEYSPGNAIPFISRIDAGIKEVVEQATGAEIHSSADVAQLVLAVLTDRQLATHRRAATACLEAKDRTFDFIARQLRAGDAVTEYTAAQFLTNQFTELGMEAHMPIVSVNANAADPHYGPNAHRHAPIREGDMILIDLWTREPGDPTNCFADSTWTAYAGKQTPAKAVEIFEIVAAARDAAVQFIQAQLDAGRTVHGHEVDTVARQVIKDAGYGDYFIHRTGHSLGPTGHYLGVNIDNLETQDRRVLLPGVMFTIEPGIYMPAFNFDGSEKPKGLGIRSEINCFMHPDRVEVTTLPVQREVRALLA